MSFVAPTDPATERLYDLDAPSLASIHALAARAGNSSAPHVRRSWSGPRPAVTVAVCSAGEPPSQFQLDDITPTVTLITG